MDYLDFDIEIREGDGQVYPVAVRSLVGEAQASAAFPFTDTELENHLLRLENAILRSAGRRGKALSEEEQTIQTLGQQLFDFLLAGDLRALYYECQREAAHRNQGVRLRLHIQPPLLAMLPWEFLYDPRRSDYVCLDLHTPLVRYLDFAQRIPPLAVTPPLRILGMVASPRDLPALDVEQEKQRVERALHHLREQGSVELTWVTGPTWRDLQRVMRPGQGPWHIFHFIGHGGVDLARNEGFVMLADEQGQSHRISATQLGRLLAGQRHALRLVILNACEGARGGRADTLSSTAAVLVYSGLPAVLAMQYAITDVAAVEFAQTFYEALAVGLPVDTAVADARNAINLRNEYSLEWSTPVLYMCSPNGKIFDVAASKLPQALPVIEEAPPSQPIVTLPPKLEETSPTEQPISAVEAEAPLSQSIATLPPKLEAISPTEQPVSAVEAVTRATTPKDEPRYVTDSVVVHVVRRDWLDIVRNGWDIVGKLIGVVILLYVGTFGIQVYQDKQHSIQATATQEAYYAIATATAVALDSQGNVGRAAEQDQQGSMLISPTVVTLLPTTTPALQASETRTNPKDGAVYVWIPSGEFTMGSSDADTLAHDNEKPQHTVEVDGFWIMQTEVTNAQYKSCVDASVCTQPDNNHWNDATYAEHPVTDVDWNQAKIYAEWVGGRLPTEAEWEKACRGTDGRIYPWGNESPSPDLLNYDGSGKGATMPVGSYPPGANSLLDMGGNVWEWTNSMDWDYPYVADDGREEPGGDAYRTLRGGSFTNNDNFVRCAFRLASPSFFDLDVFSFRVVMSLPPGS